jgi:hypothetical protein
MAALQALGVFNIPFGVALTLLSSRESARSAADSEGARRLDTYLPLAGRAGS